MAFGTLARRKEFESPTFRLGGGRSILLSYRRIFNIYIFLICSIFNQYKLLNVSNVPVFANVFILTIVPVPANIRYTQLYSIINVQNVSSLRPPNRKRSTHD